MFEKTGINLPGCLVGVQAPPGSLPSPNPTEKLYNSVILKHRQREDTVPCISGGSRVTFWNYAIGQTYPRPRGNLQPSHSSVGFCGTDVNLKKKSGKASMENVGHLNNAELVSSRTESRGL